MAEVVTTLRHGGLTADRRGYEIEGRNYTRFSKVKDAWPKPWLAPWMVKNVAEQVVEQLGRSDFLLKMCQEDPEGALRHVKGLARRKSNKALQRGTDTHTAVEHAIVTGDYFAAPAGFQEFVSRFEPEFLDVERTVFDPDLGVAGTFDARAEIDGDLWLLDWKTGRVYDEHALQLAFYSYAPFVWDLDGDAREPWEGAQRAGVVLLDESGDDMLVEFTRLDEAFELFKALHKVSTADLKALRKGVA